MPTVVYAESATPFLQVTCGSADKTDTGWSWDTDESYNGTLTLNGYDGEEIAIGGVNNGKVDIVLVGDNKITVTAPYGNRAISAHNISTLTFKGSGSLTIDFQHTATERSNMSGICIYGESSLKNNGNLVFDESCTVTVKVYGEVADKNGSVDAIYMDTDSTGSGNVTVGENATLNIDLKCDKDYQTYGIFAKGNIAFNGTVDIKMEYTGSGSTYDTWRDVNVSSSYDGCSIGTNAKITSVCPGSTGSTLQAFPLVANAGAKISSWTYVVPDEVRFENDYCLIIQSVKSPNNAGYKNYSYAKLATPLTFEDKAEYDVIDSVYGDEDATYSLVALSATGGSGEYEFEVVNATNGNKSGIGISAENKIYVNPTTRGVSEATEITVKVTDKGGYSKDITVHIGAVVAPTYSAIVDNVDFGTVRVGYSSVTQVPIRISNTGTGKINCNGHAVELIGENASSFTLGFHVTPYHIGVGAENTSSWSIKPNSGLAVGTYSATIKFTGTAEYTQFGTTDVEASATVKFVVTEHDFDTSTWEYDENKHWNPCKDTGCAVHGNEAAHDTNGELKNAVEATFDADGYTGDKYCSVCGAKSEDGTVIPAGKYIRVSQATMEPSAITDQLTVNDLVFKSLDTSKYTVALYNWRVYDLTDEALNTDEGKYPKDSKFVAEHQYAIEIEFTAVSPYKYEEMHDTHWSTFTVNGQPTAISSASTLGGSHLRRITLVAKDTTIPVTVTDVQISFSEVNVQRGEKYSLTATVSGTGAFDNTVTWSVIGVLAGTSISSDGVLTIATNESASTITIKAISKQDNTKYATKTVTIISLIIVSQKGVETQYKVAAGETINLTAETASNGYHFKEWQVTGAGTFADKTAKQTKFTVPCENVTVMSVYELHSASSAEWLTDSTKHYHVCSCGEKVDIAPHTAGKAWCSDGDDHWHICTECNAKLDVAKHVYDNGVDTTCNVCGYERPEHTHTATAMWGKDETNHWHDCSVDGCSEKLDVAEHVYDNGVDTTCNICGYERPEHTHSAMETWNKDETNHWHDCSVDGCSEKADIAPHTPDREEATETEAIKCSVCGYIITPALGHVTHTSSEEWLSDETNHWHTCTGCSQKLDISEHTYGEWSVTIQPQVGVAGKKERECSICGYKEIAPVDALKEQITVNVEGGNVNGGTSITVDKDGTVTVVANPAPEGKTFKGWSIDGGQTIVSEDETYSFSATENITLTAVYDNIEQLEKTGLSGGAIAGITIACVVLAGFGGFAIFWFVVKKKKIADLIAIFKKK